MMEHWLEGNMYQALVLHAPCSIYLSKSKVYGWEEADSLVSRPKSLLYKPFWDMADTMLQHYKVWVNVCAYTQTKQYTPVTSAMPQKSEFWRPAKHFYSWCDRYSKIWRMRIWHLVPHIRLMYAMYPFPPRPHFQVWTIDHRKTCLTKMFRAIFL